MSTPDYDGTAYLDWPEIEARLAAMVASAPEWAKLETVGESHEGRALHLLTLGDLGGDPDARPGFWLDGGTHAAEWTGVMSALFSASRWIASLREGDEAARAWFATHTVYVMPCVSPDGYASMREGGMFLRSSKRPPRDGRPRAGLEPHDLDGDGKIRLMRWRHPTGPWVFDDPRNPAKMRRRKIDDDPAEAWFVCDEGTFRAWDGYRWLDAPREFGVDLNRNFPSRWEPFEMFGMDSGDFPLSEPESRAMVQALRARPRVAAALTNHTYTGCVLSHPYRDPSPLPEVDIKMLEDLARGLAEGTGYAVYKVVPDFTYDAKKPIVGVWADTLAATFGIPGYTVELWDPFGFAGVKVDKPAEMFLRPDEEKLHAMLDAFVDEPGAIGPWTAHAHPQLGEVEIGGIEYMTTVRNPPERLLPEECEKGFTIADRMRRALPSVQVEARQESLGDGLTRVELRVENLGLLPTSGLRHAEAIGTAPPLHVQVEGLELVEGDAQRELGWLDGWGSLHAGPARHPIYPGLPLDRGPRARAVWVVRGAGALQLRWDAGRGGRGAIDLVVG